MQLICHVPPSAQARAAWSRQGAGSRHSCSAIYRDSHFTCSKASVVTGLKGQTARMSAQTPPCSPSAWPRASSKSCVSGGLPGFAGGGSSSGLESPSPSLRASELGKKHLHSSTPEKEGNSRLGLQTLQIQCHLQSGTQTGAIKRVRSWSGRSAPRTGTAPPSDKHAGSRSHLEGPQCRRARLQRDVRGA